MTLAGRRVLLVVTGGIAAYKALELVRLLQKSGCGVTAVLTEAGARFVTALSLQALTGEKVYTDLWSLTDESEMGHIQLSRAADLVVVVPASADMLARMAAGLAGDLAATLLLATDKPVLAVPAMNVRMWQHAATQRNVATLRASGVTLLEPDDGAMACGEYGPGRLPEPPMIMAAIMAANTAPNAVANTGVAGAGLIAAPTPGALAGRHVLITAGPTHEAIDPVRYLANRSSGKQGFAIAQAAAAAGARVTLVAGPVALPTPPGVTRIDVTSAVQMAAAVVAALPADIAVMVAAVADWRAADTADHKLKKDGTGAVPPLHLVENPDILAMLCTSPQRPALVIGFAAETCDVIAHAQAKLVRKGADWIVANDVSGDVMGGDRNAVHIVTSGHVETLPDMPKPAVAAALVERIARVLA